MQILKGKKDRHPEENQYVSRIDQVEVRVDKLASKNKAYREAALSADFTDGEGRTALQQYNSLMDEQVDHLMSTYIPSFARRIRPELVPIENGRISWNRESLIILSRDNNEWYRFKKLLDREILTWAGVDLNNFTVDIEVELEKALHTAAEKINNLRG